MKTATFRPSKLLSLRNARKLTQTDLAFELRRRHGIKTDQGQVARWEAGQHTPRASVIPALADVLSCSMDELYGDSEDEESDSTVLERAARMIADNGDYELAAALHRQAVRAAEKDRAA